MSGARKDVLGFVVGGAPVVRGSRARLRNGVCQGRRRAPICAVRGESEGTGRLKVAGALGSGLLIAGAVAAGASGAFSMESLGEFSEWVLNMGTTGQLAYGFMYTMLEVVAFPALPLTLACGYLFGPVKGTAIVSVSSTTAAGLSFLISRYLLSGLVGRVAEKNPQFRRINRVVSKEGFKYTLLLRLSPLMPFALGNYLYGLTSLRFVPYIVGSWIGMLPGTIAYVLAGASADALTSGTIAKSSPTQIGLLGAGVVATGLVLYNLTKAATSSLEEEQQQLIAHKDER